MKNEMKYLMPQELVIVANVTRAMMGVINARLFTLLGMVLAACLFGWVMWQPDWIRFAGAGAFAIFVYLPAQRMEHNRLTAEKEQQNAD